MISKDESTVKKVTYTKPTVVDLGGLEMANSGICDLNGQTNDGPCSTGGTAAAACSQGDIPNHPL